MRQLKRARMHTRNGEKSNNERRESPYVFGDGLATKVKDVVKEHGAFRNEKRSLSWLSKRSSG